MDRVTIAALDRINRDFYAAHAAEFIATREAPWPGWTRVLSHLAGLVPEEGGALRILDVGCGSGRLGRWLRVHLDRPHRYFGLDRSLPVVAIGRGGSAADSSGATDRAIDAPAAAPATSGARWLLADLLEARGTVPCRDASFDAALAIGLLHHLPSFDLRRALVADLLRLLPEGGLVGLAFWQFGADERFRGRVVPWEEDARRRCALIDTSQLEPGDSLLTWGPHSSGAGALRYCHYTSPGEARRLTSGLPATIVDTFHADGHSGRLNLYQVLRRS